MKQKIEPSIKKNRCSYCGDAPVDHHLKYIENMISATVDSHIVKVTSYAPKFLKDFAGWVPVFLFNTLRIFNRAHFSSDIEKAHSFRSRVIWEEAEKRGIQMEQVIIGKKPLDWYRARINGKTIYFESIPVQPEFLDFKRDWDDKIVLKKELSKHGIPVPKYAKLSPFGMQSLESIFSKFNTPVIVKPLLGSRARHTVTNITSLKHFKEGVAIVKQISPYIVVEEHLYGHVCRATLIGGVLAGFYKGELPFIIGDGKKTIQELIVEKDEKRNPRYHIRIVDELHDHLSRSGLVINDILSEGEYLALSHRTGQLFGGMTEEMIDDLHPSFIPILEKAAKVVGLPVIGFDCIVPDPTKDESSQRWGIIECNTLPFINMHYYALEGKPRNIAGMVWDLWK
jgi:cyanophycin synthetase